MSSTAKSIDIYDANLAPLGTMDRNQAHYEGQWHRTFHCWVYRDKPSPALLFQQRSPNSKNFPNALDVSAAGHLKAGTSVADGIVEVHEELGIDATFSHLTHVGERVEVGDESNGHRNREYQSVFMLRDDRDLAQYVPRVHEVWGLYWLPLAAGMRLMATEIPHTEVDGISYDPQRAAFVPHTLRITTSDFLPRIQRYYLAALIAAERLLEGKKYVSIS